MPTFLIAAALALGAAGAATSVVSAQHANKFQKEMISEQEQMEAQRKQQMALEAKRAQLETLRQAQRARSVSTAVASNQGALFGSGAAGAQGQISGQENTQLLGQAQNLQIGNNIFDLNSQLSQSKIGYANAQTLGAVGSGLSSFGSSLMSASGAAGRLGGGFGGSSGGFGSSAYNPGLRGSLY